MSSEVLIQSRNERMCFNKVHVQTMTVFVGIAELAILIAGIVLSSMRMNEPVPPSVKEDSNFLWNSYAIEIFFMCLWLFFLCGLCYGLLENKPSLIQAHLSYSIFMFTFLAFQFLIIWAANPPASYIIYNVIVCFLLQYFNYITYRCYVWQMTAAI